MAYEENNACQGIGTQEDETFMREEALAILEKYFSTNEKADDVFDEMRKPVAKKDESGYNEA